MHPIHTVGQNVLRYPLVSVLTPLCCHLGHSYQLPEIYLKPLFAIISARWPGSLSFAVWLQVQSGTCWTMFLVCTWRSRKCGVWYMTIFQTKRKRTAVNWKEKQKGKNQGKIINNISEKDCFALNRKMIYHCTCAPERFYAELKVSCFKILWVSNALMLCISN